MKVILLILSLIIIVYGNVIVHGFIVWHGSGIVSCYNNASLIMSHIPKDIPDSFNKLSINDTFYGSICHPRDGYINNKMLNIDVKYTVIYQDAYISYVYEDMMFCFNEIICTEEDLILSLPEENEFQHIVIDSKYISELELNVLAIDKRFKRVKSSTIPQ